MRKIKIVITDLAFLFFWGPFRIAVKMLPVKIVFFLSKIVASLLFKFYRKNLGKIIDDLCKTDSKDHTLRIAKKSFEIYIKRNVENLFMGNLTKEYLDRIVTIEGVEHLNAALKKEKGVIIQLSHFGSFMTILPALGFKGFTINQLVGKPEVNRPVLKWMYETKVKENSGLPVKFLHVDRSVRPVIKALKNNELVAIALDGRDGTDWVTVPFLDRQASLSPGPVRIAALTGAVILPTFMIRQPDDTHRLILEQPLILEQNKDKQKFITTNMEKIAKIFENYIQKYPCHFAMTINAINKREDKNLVVMPLFTSNK
ncbi:MAG: lysophospholipid acyltransferase family protein [Deltaproteobacteria bacterium]|nr:lysophospholipid acyltransferase family protein [Deltaproteobacteria bacterium]